MYIDICLLHHHPPLLRSRKTTQTFSCDKTSNICQVQPGKLDNAVQATQFINSTLPHPVHKQSEGHFRRVVSSLLQRKSTHVKEDSSSEAAGVCKTTWKLDIRWLEKSLVVWWNKDKQDWIRWEGLCMETKGRIHLRSHYTTNSEAWRGE